MVNVIEDRARGLAYEVPPGHRLDFDPRSGTVSLRAPRGGSTFQVKGAGGREDETVYALGDRVSDDEDGPYPEPTPGEEIERLEEAIASAGGDQTKASAWAQGEGYVDHIARLRTMLRELRANS